MKKKSLICAIILFCCLLFACSNIEKDTENVKQESNQVMTEKDNQEKAFIEDPVEETVEEPLTDDNSANQGVKGNNSQDDISLTIDLEEHDSKLMQKADGWSNGYMFDCTWRGDNVSFNNGIMTLKIDSDYENSGTKWSGGEYRTNDFFHYGKYEVRMKPIKNDGVVSSFFTYTGPSDGNPWDEIDIEFLGKDTTKIQFNYFTNGVGEHEFVYELGFDASEEFHDYGFEWLEESIAWYVDGVAVHTADVDIPSTPSKIMMNVWPGVGVDSWLNAFDGQVPLEAQYDWIRYTK